MKRLSIFVLVLLLKNGLLFAQPDISQLNSLSFPTANNNFLGKVASSPSVGVDHYTGTVQVGVPICNLAGKELNLPISLDYADGRGVKVQEYASQVGLGWQLNAGGAISRVVRGFPDEKPNGYLGTGHWGQILSTAFNNNTTISNANYTSMSGCSIDGNGFQNCTALPVADGEPDIFYVKTPFFSFQFVFDQFGNPVVSNYNGYQVIPSNFVGSTTGATSFEVIDDKGNQYFFGTIEQSNDSLYNVPYSFPSSWYLDKIVSFNSKDVITFSYQRPSILDVTYNYSWSEIENSLIQTKTTLSTGKNTISVAYVSKIASSLGEVDFSYAFDRQDDPLAARLSTIQLKAFDPVQGANTTSLSTYTFNYGYFNSPSTDPNLLRLRLNNVQVSGSGVPTMTMASFGYNTSVNLPNRTLPIFDYWGYCTTAQSPTDIFLISRGPDATMTQADILTSITTLMGGTYNLFYELNDYGPGTSTVGGLRVNKISQTLPTGENIYKTYSYTDGSSNSSGQIFNSLYSQLSFSFFSGSSGATLYMSGSPYTVNDVNGTFVGYSRVKETLQNGGYSVFTFTNFNDPGDSDVLKSVGASGQVSFPLIFSTTSVGYRRSLLNSLDVYTAEGNHVSQDSYTYTPLNSSVTKTGWGFRPFNISAVLNNLGGSINGFYTVYYTPVENYRLSQAVHRTYDQVTPANYVQTSTNYGYDAVHWLVNNITTTDSKGQTFTQQFYHSGDGGIPMMTSSELSAVGQMAQPNVNCRNVVIHEIDTRGVSVMQVHNSYTLSSAGAFQLYLLTSNSVYTGSTLQKQQNFNYDAQTAQLLSANMVGDKSTSLAYGYNSSSPVVKIENASSASVTSQQTVSNSATLDYSGGSTTFTMNGPGTIQIRIGYSSVPSNTNSTFGNYTVSGGASFSGQLCVSTNNGCGEPSTVTDNVNVGTYTVTATGGSTSDPNSMPKLFITYSYTGPVFSYSNEFFYEGFETISTSGLTTPAHTGNGYYNSGSYSVPFNPPATRSYVIQWWNLVGGNWVFNQQPYTAFMVLPGPGIDDVRVFPADALMTTYTYNPQLGVTSQTDPSGRSQLFEYDVLGRLLRVRDQDKNILKQYDYQYQVGTQQ